MNVIGDAVSIERPGAPDARRGGSAALALAGANAA